MILDSKNYDIRKTKDARFMDQKVTPDVLSCVSECIIKFLCEDTNKPFSIKDIQDLNYSHYIVKDIFNKPEIESAPNEYDKFFPNLLKCFLILGFYRNQNIKIEIYIKFKIFMH